MGDFAFGWIVGGAIRGAVGIVDGVILAVRNIVLRSVVWTWRRLIRSIRS